MFSKQPKKSPNIWNTFDTKFVTNMCQKSPNLRHIDGSFEFEFEPLALIKLK